MTGGFDGKTILLTGAGCAAGAILARDFARAGGHVIIVDYDERALLQIARAAPARIDPLRLDYLEARQLQRFADIWQDEPLHVLVQLQALRLQARPGLAISSILQISEAMQPALRAGRGRVLLVMEAVADDAPLMRRAFDCGMQGIARLLDKAQSGSGIRTSAMELQGTCTAESQSQFSDLTLALTSPGSLLPGGGTWRLDAFHEVSPND